MNRGEWLAVSLLAIGLLAFGAHHAGPSGRRDVERALRAIAAGHRAASDVSVSYDDMHAFWGGVTMSVSKAGSYERTQRARGANAPRVITTASVDAREVRELAGLLLELKAWEQETPERAPFPEESRATLTIRVGDTKISIWEWYNDLAKNGRLIRIRDRMLELGKQARLGDAPKKAL
jgi:hypothetical protein